MGNFQDQLEALSKQMADITKDLSAGKLSPDLVKDLQGNFYADCVFAFNLDFNKPIRITARSPVRVGNTIITLSLLEQACFRLR